MYSEAHIKLREPVYFDSIHSRNFFNEENTVFAIVMQKPFDLPWMFTLDGGPMLHIQGYNEWNPITNQSEKKEVKIFGAFLVPEADVNWGIGSLWCNARVRDELKVKWNGEFDTNLFLAQFRAWHKYFQLDAAYSTCDLGKLGGVRYPGTSSELRLRAGLVFSKYFEIGAQRSWAYYQSEIWESQFKPQSGIYTRMNLLPFWLEFSWEKMNVRERDRRNGITNPDFTQNRLFFGIGYSQDQNVRR